MLGEIFEIRLNDFNRIMFRKRKNGVSNHYAWSTTPQTARSQIKKPFIMLSKITSFIGISLMLVACNTAPNLDENILYKILTPQQWQEFQSTHTFSGSEMDTKDGFIHLSFKNQVDGIRQKFFKENAELVLISLDSSKLSNEFLKIEANKPGGNKYPHYYAHLNIAMVIESKAID